LRNALVWLDNWESNVTKNLISEDKFLTKNTAEGLIVTIQSTIDIINYLHGCGFDYVLTSKINQDCVEVSILHSNYLFEINKNYIINYFYNFQKFFGIIRQVAGPNDHPSTPTFLQLYRMLSVYSLVKPPKTGNCTILEGINGFSLKININ